MQRYFFDLVGQRAEYDFSGQLLPSLKRARELAELMAMDLAIEHDERWQDWCVDVLTARGRRIHSVLVRSHCLAA